MVHSARVTHKLGSARSHESRAAAIRDHRGRTNSRLFSPRIRGHHDVRDRLRRLGPQVAPRQALSRDGRRRTRWLVRGFHVAYFKDNSLAKRHGHFDLRNVMSAGPSADPNAADAVDLVISTDGAGPPKTLTLSFDGADGPQWKHLLASAVDGRRVSGDLATFRSEALAPTRSTTRSRACARRRGPTKAATCSRRARRPPTTERRRWARCRACRTSRAAAASARCPRATTCSTRPRGGPSDEPALFEVSVPAGAVAGDVLHSTLPSGATVRFTVPPGANAFPTSSPSASRGRRPPPEVRARRRRRRRRHRRRRRTQRPGAGARLRAAAWSGGGRWRRRRRRRRRGSRSGGRATCRWARCGGR